MSTITAGIAAQQAVSQLNLSANLVKAANKADQAIVSLIAASADQSRGQNLDITV